MVTKKNKTDNSDLSKNNGDSVKYRIRKQEEKESNELLQEYLDDDDDVLGGDPVEVPGSY